MSQNLPLQIKNLVHPNDVEIPYLKRPLPSPPIEIEKRICLDQGYQEIITFPISPISPTVAFPITNRPIAQPIPRKPIVKKPSHMISDCGKRIWELIRSIGKGGCGEVYLGKELNKPNQVVAVKIIKDRKQFLSELNTMKLLHHNEQGRGYTPKLLCALKKRKTLVMELLGDTVALKFEQARYKFSLKTIVMLALNMVLLTN
jgi:hypothetical protein